MTPTCPVWIIEDDVSYRRAVASVLKSSPTTTLTGQFGSVEDALTALSTQDAPEVLLLDINLPGMDGLEGVGHLKAHAPEMAIVMLTIHDEEAYLFSAFRAGASGYLLKNAPLRKILQGIAEAQQGGMLMTAPLARQVQAFFAQQASSRDTYGLSGRELEVLQALSLGHTKTRIAQTLFISPHTVDSHVRSIYRKLHVHSNIEAVAKALRERLI